jgi:hypothetical protein
VRIRGVEFPPAVIDAHKAGDLVLFVGAGASMREPSSLPGFKRLVEIIRDEAGLTTVIGDLNGEPDDSAAGDSAVAPTQMRTGPPLDEVMGRMEDVPYGIKVHERVAYHIGNPDSRPNDCHAAIARLASAGYPRIVITNYDEHLTVSLSPSTPDYFAPALPMGDNFHGLVYLHGALSHGADSLIVTDRDFGRAYLTDAWAARFVERMFTRYTVLFIGYSHNDVIMKYLARGLGRAKDRFILTPDPSDRLWTQLGITPIEYKKGPDGSHDALWNALDGWASHAEMGLLEHDERVKDLVSTQVPPLTPEDNSYLESIVADEETVKIFTDHARDPAWLWWAAERPQFRTLFNLHPGPTTEAARRLALWFAEHYVTEAQSGDALAVVYALGGRLGPELAYAVSRRLNNLPNPCPAALRPWLLLAVRDARNQPPEFFNFLWSSTLWTQDPDSALYLLIHLTEPEPRLMPGLLDTTRLEVGLRGNDYWLRDAWKTVYQPVLSEAAEQLLPVIDQHLRRAHLEFTIAEGPDAVTWPSSGRTAIEPDPGDQFPTPLGFLIDAARDCIESLLSTAVDQASAQIASWAASDKPLLRRLAIHGWIERQDVSAAEKLAWLRTQPWLLDFGLRHEILRLLASTLPDIDAEATNAVVDDVVAAANADDSKLQRAARILAFIVQRSPNPASAGDALDAITSAHPELQPPDGSAAISADAVSADDFPATPDEFHAKLAGNLPAIREVLIQYEAKQNQFDAPQWVRMAQLVREVVKQWPGDGFTVLDAVGADHPDVARAVIYGWADAHLDEDAAQQVLAHIDLLELPQIVDAVASMLAGYRSGGDDHSTNWRTIPGSRALATKCWNSIDPDTPSELQGSDWSNQAINHPGGRLADFWILTIEADWKAHTDTWNGLTPETAGNLEAMLGTNDKRGEMVHIMLPNHIRFIHEADAAWCEQNVLPLLRWDDPDRARRAWGGYLSHGSWSNKLLAAGLLQLLLDTVPHRDDLSEQRGWKLLAQLAEIAVYAEIDPADWLRDFIQRATLAVRVEWAEQIAHVLRTSPPEVVEAQWQRWIRAYWNSRLEGSLMGLTTEEATAMAEWAVYLTDSQEEGIGLALQHEAGLASETLLFNELRQQDRIARAAQQFAELIAHLLKGTQPPCYAGYDLPTIVSQLKQHGVSEESIRPIRAQALRLDIPLPDD